MTIRDFQTIYHGEVEILKDWNMFDISGVTEILLDAEIDYIEPQSTSSDYNWIRIYI